jgi:hypothetical protein
MSLPFRILPPVVVLVAACCLAQEEQPSEDGAEKEAAAKFRVYAKEVATAYELKAGDSGERKLRCVAEPVLRWTNPLGGQRARGEIYLWTDAGLPAAIVSINEFTDTEGRMHGEQEWCSLAQGRLSRRDLTAGPRPPESFRRRHCAMSRRRQNRQRGGCDRCATWPNALPARRRPARA